jgi:hypothetical protein
MRTWVQVTVTSLFAGPALAADINVTVEIPRLGVAAYHKPYLAVWIERPGAGAVSTLAVWYDVAEKNEEGEKWLKDLRMWWRRTGREMQLPADGITGATRAPGSHQLTFKEGKAPLTALPAGQYELVIEAAREAGGRELLRIPFEWPVSAPVSVSAQGTDELGSIFLNIKP